MRTSGYATINESGIITNIGTFKTSPQRSDQERLNEIFVRATELIDKYPHYRVVIEDIQSQNNNISTFKKLAYAQSAILLAAEQRGKDVELISASSWRSHLSKKYGITFGRVRKNQKEVALKLIKEILENQEEHSLYTGPETITQDMADAACIALAVYDELNS